ncbi:MAG TPA: bifunctional [glutamate--ammonia ligase]-adenylyl-L-tyrosine phosphorylase/[glutamate--ammonia-ligase] adenylyltransferase [Pirellulaceae bacterium]|nr:bifunctional [glutamate--ammonia ligase]-adenylyl-L-tyrosine phosphorylase/[glutamate--ammonia-ligase] adenylyltransferase [Pirellulaceae bacterium]
MEIAQLVQWLDQPDAALEGLRAWGLHDVTVAHANLLAISQSGLTLDLLAVLCDQLVEHLPHVSDPDMALNNLQRYIAASRNPLSLGGLLERDPEALPTLLTIFSASQHFSDLLVRDPESYDLLRVTDGQPVAREVLIRELCREVAALSDERAVMTALRRYKQRETLRIAFGDLVKKQRVETVIKQISFLADALCEAALQAARKKLVETRGEPLRADGTPAQCVALALGKLGGVELNYSSDIDLVFLYDGEGQTTGPRVTSNAEFFDRLAKQVIKLLSEVTELGFAYRVDMRLRPEGAQGSLVISRDSALHYYDVLGRTWERQAFVKARPLAGDIELGRAFLSQLEPWIYRRYLTLGDITGIKALKRRIEQRAVREGGDTRDVKTGHGGIRDIEFVIQFLQLLNGGDLPRIRTPGTLDAIAQLEQAGCLTMQERSILEENYAFLRKIEHRLQIMFDLQTHTLPDSDDELRKLAVRMGYLGTPHQTALAAFKADYKQKTELNRKILDHLLHSAFVDDSAAEPEVDLVLDPNPSADSIREVLSKYGFQDIPAAYQNLMALSTEKVAFLSTHRCRHFLAAIASRLLTAVAATPDPDFTLLNLSQVSDSLGGKGVLWELFSFSPPSLRLYVMLCASSPYLSSILTTSPGMIDELMDSLVLDKLPTLEPLEATLAELCRAAEDIDPILHSFKHSQHLRVGVRDILGKEDLPGSHRALSDIAEVCLRQIAEREYEKLVEKHGEPIIVNRPREGQVSEFVMLAVGKMGAREPNYHSDVDLIFLYEADGSTRHRQRSRRDASTTNQHFFSQLAQRIVKVASQLGPFGRLYEVDARLRPTGRSGSLAISFVEFAKYFEEGQGQLWERQLLCKARPIFGSPAAREMATQLVYGAITCKPWQPEMADEIRRMRMRMEQNATRRNLKRGAGGTVDIEFIVETLQLKYAAEQPAILATGTLGAIAALSELGLLAEEDASYLHTSYRFLRSIEARLRLMNTTARHDLPDDDAELRKLAYLFQYPSADELRQDCEHFTRENRRRFEKIFAAEGVALDPIDQA